MRIWSCAHSTQRPPRTEPLGPTHPFVNPNRAHSSTHNVPDCRGAHYNPDRGWLSLLAVLDHQTSEAHTAPVPACRPNSLLMRRTGATAAFFTLLQASCMGDRAFLKGGSTRSAIIISTRLPAHSSARHRACTCRTQQAPGSGQDSRQVHGQGRVITDQAFGLAVHANRPERSCKAAAA